MSSAIEWTDATWNPVVGCSPVSEGCRNCYAARDAVRLAGNPNPKISEAYAGTSEMRGTGPRRRAVFTGVVRTLEDRLEQPLRWRKPRRVFVNSMSDLFHPDVPFEFVDRVFGVMATSPHHVFQILTKRPERMAEYSYSRQLLLRARATWDHPVQREVDRWVTARPTHEDAGVWEWPLPNVWLGTSVEDQATADERIPQLLRTPAAVRFLSCEPLIGPVNLFPWLRRATHCHDCGETFDDGRDGCPSCWEPTTVRGPDGEPPPSHGLHWVIAGGESGPGARCCDVAWIRALVEQCRAAGVPAFVKQLGAKPWDSTDETIYVLGDRKGGDPYEWPTDLQVREFPEVSRG